MFRKLLIVFSFCMLVDLSNGMVRSSSPYGVIEHQLSGVNQLCQTLRTLPSYPEEQADLNELYSLLNKLQNRLLHIENNKKGDITPEDAGNIVRKFRLQNDRLILDESSSGSLIESFTRINGVLLGKDRSISDNERVALLLVLECYANAVPGELTYLCDDEEQMDIIEAAYSAYAGVQ